MIGMFIAVLVAVSSLAFVFDRQVAARHPESLWNWRSQFFSTLISVVLGFVVGMTLYNVGQRSATRNDKARYTRLLGYELAADKNILKDAGGSYFSVGGKKYPLLVTHVEPVALEDAARSGLFTESVTEDLMKLARILRVINIEGQAAINLTASVGGDDPVVLERLRFASENLEKARAAGLDCIQSITDGIAAPSRN